MALAGGPTVTLTFKGDTDDLKQAIAGIGTMVAGLGATVGILGGIGAAAGVASLAVAAVPLAFLGIGIAAAAQSQMVKDRFTALKDHVMAEMSHMTASIQGELLIAADHLQAWFDRLSPTFENLFKLSAPYLQIFLDGVLSLVERALPGLQKALENGRPIAEAFGRGLGTIGEGIGLFFARLTEGSPGAVQALDALFGLTRDLLDYLGQLIAQLANALGPAFADLRGPLMDVVRGLGDGLLAIVKVLAPYIGPLGRDIADFLVAALRMITPILEILLPLLADFATMLLETITPIVKDLSPIFRDVVSALADGLRPILPVIKEGFERMAPTIREIAEKAGPLLVEIIRDLAPLLVTLAQGAIDLTAALLPVIPPLLEMANNAMPLVKGVIQDVLIPVIKWLVEEFKGLIEYGVKIAEKFAELSVRWRTYWDEIKAAFADADAKIRAGIEAFASLPETARRHWDAIYQAIKDKISAIVTEVVAFPGKLLDAILAPVKKFYDAGASLIQSFADGINSKADAAKDAAGNVVGGTEALFPQSPPPEGPFSGEGWTLYRGQALIDGFIEGLQAAAPRLYAALTSILANAQTGVSDMTSAVQELLKQASRAPGTILEDLSFGGMSDTLQKYNDQIADMFYKTGGAHGIEELKAWAGKQFGLTQAEDLSWVRSAFYGGGAPAAGGGSGALQLSVAPGVDSALSSMLMNLVRTGQLQLAVG